MVGQVSSLYDGHTKNLGSNENHAKLLWEPLIIGFLGFAALRFYQYQDIPPKGLPYFLLLSIVTLPFVEGVHQTIWNRQIQAMNDARIENEVRKCVITG